MRRLQFPPIQTVAFLPLAILGVAAGASAQARADADYIVGPRDLLAVQVFGEPTLSGNYRVEADGGFAFPLIGRVQAARKTLRQTEEDIRRRLADGFYRDPQVSVTVQEYGSQKIFVIGEVRSPGSYPLSGEMTLLAALAQAGSTAPEAGDEVIVLRPRDAAALDVPLLPDQDDGNEFVRVSLRALQTGVAGDRNVVLQNGDTVYVPKVELIFVTGQVRSAGSFPMREGLTVLQAIALAGGLTDRGTTSRLRIMRTVDGKRVEIKVKATDFVQPGDTVVVLERFF
jgi:polysaccharide export outer membrane protein